jgi:hypothetical protein
MCHGNRNHALAKVVHNDIDQTSYWMISLHPYENISLGQLPRVRTMLAPAYMQHCANVGSYINIKLRYYGSKQTRSTQLHVHTYMLCPYIISILYQLLEEYK